MVNQRKKCLLFVPVIALLVGTGCGSNTEKGMDTVETVEVVENVEMSETEKTQSTELEMTLSETEESDVVKTIRVEPLPTYLDLEKLDDCMFAASFESKDVTLNEDGALVVTMKVCDYERFDAVDMSQLGSGDTLVLNGEDVLIGSIDYDANYIIINGGLEKGGHDMYTDEDGVYYEVFMDAGANYYELGEVTIPVSQDFVFTDNADPDNQGKTYYAGDFLINMENSDEFFSSSATRVRVEDGKVVELTRNYMP